MMPLLSPSLPLSLSFSLSLFLLSLSPSRSASFSNVFGIVHSMQYHVGHFRKSEEIMKASKTLYDGRLILTGNSYHGVSVNDCIVNAKEAVDGLKMSEGAFTWY